MDKAYPDWVCAKCATEAGGRTPFAATYHEGPCDVCGLIESVTQPRDYGYPDFTKVITRLANEAQRPKADRNPRGTSEVVPKDS